MQIKDKFGSKITLYQAKNGAVYLQFGNQSVELSQEQAEKLCSPHDLEDFELEAYQKHYQR